MSLGLHGRKSEGRVDDPASLSPCGDARLRPRRRRARRTNKPSFTSASAHHWRSRTAASGLYVPSWEAAVGTARPSIEQRVIPSGDQQRLCWSPGTAIEIVRPLPNGVYNRCAFAYETCGSLSRQRTQPMRTPAIIRSLSTQSRSEIARSGPPVVPRWSITKMSDCFIVKDHTATRSRWVSRGLRSSRGEVQHIVAKLPLPG
jgi:hypothetical protein